VPVAVAASPPKELTAVRCLVVLIAFVLAHSASAAELPTIVVAPLRAIEAAGSASQIISEQIRAFVGRSGKYTLVSPEEMNALDAELERQLSGGCDEASCVAQLGGALGAEFLLTGSLGLIGKTYVLNLKLIDIETASAKANAKPIMASSLDEIVRRVDEATADLLGTAGPVATPQPRAAAVPVRTVATRSSDRAPSTTSRKAGLSGPQIAAIVVGVAVVVVVAGLMMSSVDAPMDTVERPSDLEDEPLN
jgi:TolB-like protein